MSCKRLWFILKETCCSGFRSICTCFVFTVSIQINNFYSHEKQVWVRAFLYLWHNNLSCCFLWRVCKQGFHILLDDNLDQVFTFMSVSMARITVQSHSRTRKMDIFVGSNFASFLHMWTESWIWCLKQINKWVRITDDVKCHSSPAVLVWTHLESNETLDRNRITSVFVGSVSTLNMWMHLFIRK